MSAGAPPSGCRLDASGREERRSRISTGALCRWCSQHLHDFFGMRMPRPRDARLFYCSGPVADIDRLHRR